jgi:hypothetical protein
LFVSVSVQFGQGSFAIFGGLVLSVDFFAGFEFVYLMSA